MTKLIIGMLAKLKILHKISYINYQRPINNQIINKMKINPLIKTSPI
jgi:hypothetical protein